jgi:hypothetical protein
MSSIDRRAFISSAASVISLPLLSALETKAANSKTFRFVLPENETTFAVGENVPLRIFTKTQYPRLQVNFKANGQLIGTARAFPYQVIWTPTATGDYTLTVEISALNGNFVINENVKVFNLLYDAIGRRGNRLYNVEGLYESYHSTMIPEIAGYGVPLNFVGTQLAPQTIRRIEIVVSATTRLYNDWRNLTFPQFSFVQARLWNNGTTGFQTSPRNGNLADLNIGAPNFGSSTVPLATNAAGINYYLKGWNNLNIALPANVQTALSIHFAINSGFDFTERINFAQSSITVPPLLYASSPLPGSQSVYQIGASAVRIWTD